MVDEPYEVSMSKVALQAASWYNIVTKMVVAWDACNITRPRYKIGACTMSDSISRSPKVCAKCGQLFPKTMKIDGKKVYLHTRAYCLDCSPIGTRHLCGPKTKNEDKTHICSTCGKAYKGGHLIRAGICHGCVSKEQRRKKKLQVVAYLGGKCARCRYDRCVTSLHCHHLDGRIKEFSISRRQIWWHDLVKELDKCELLCANCHFERHAEITQDATSSKASYSTVKSRRKRKLRIVKHLGGKCMACGYDKTPWALHCHHTGDSQKEYSISARPVKWETLVQELDKCVLLCANCHGEHHSGLLDLSSIFPGSLEVKRAAVYRQSRMFDSSLGN